MLKKLVKLLSVLMQRLSKEYSIWSNTNGFTALSCISALFAVSRKVSVRQSVRRDPVLWPNGLTYRKNSFTTWQNQYSSFLLTNTRYEMITPNRVLNTGSVNLANASRATNRLRTAMRLRLFISDSSASWHTFIYRPEWWPTYEGNVVA